MGTWSARSTAATLAAALLAAGCAGFTPQAGPEADPPGSYVTLTLPIIAVGDTQEHLPTGHPLHDNDSAVDAYVEVAQRPPEQPLFGRRLVEWVLQQHPGEPFIHLGDILDLSCRIEARRVREVFGATSNAGAILPGNHDGLMFGIYGYDVLAGQFDSDAQKWNRGCRRGAAPDDAERRTATEALNKRDFIAGYITAQAVGRRAKPGLVPPPAQGNHRVSWRHPDPQVFLSAIEANLLDGSRYADSYLAQRLRLPSAPGATRDVIVIGMDTNQAGALVSSLDVLMGRSPGSEGHILPDQVAAVTPWVDEAVQRGDIVVFAGHHDWQSLSLFSRTLLRSLMARLDHPLVYLSAHTHSGFWAVHRALARQPLLELNVSSLSDWPIAYRRLSFAYDEQARRLLVRGELRPHGDRPNESFADLMAAWESQTCAKSGVPVELLRAFDAATVAQQRESRGSLIDWLISSAASFCESCEVPLYEHAQSYQDDLLDVLIQSSVAMRLAGIELPAPKLPPWCEGRGFDACANALISEKAADADAHKNLFRRKAQLVAAVNDHLVGLQEPRAKAYMTCRAVQAAKIDFDATPDERNENRGEAKRRTEQFFRMEASVGMD